MDQTASFEVLDFKIFRGIMPPDPSRAYKCQLVPTVVCIIPTKIDAPRQSIPGSATGVLSLLAVGQSDISDLIYNAGFCSQVAESCSES